MRVRMLTAIASERWSARDGEIVEIEAGLARRLISSGQAEAVEAVEEFATVQSSELATLRPKRRKHRTVP